jgi:hypothetical protein
MNGYRYEAIGLSDLVPPLHPVSHFHEELRWLPRMLPKGKYNLLREGHSPDGHGFRQILVFRRMNPVAERQFIPHVTRSLSSMGLLGAAG